MDIAEEKLEGCLEEIKPLWAEHWKGTQEEEYYGQIEMDVESYLKLNEVGGMRLFTLRKCGLLVGYAIFCVMGHMHAKSCKISILDLLYVSPEYRTPFISLKMLKYSINSLKITGVKMIFCGTTTRLNIGPIFRRLKMERCEEIYSLRV